MTGPMMTVEDTRYAVTLTGTPVCTHPRTGVVTSQRERGRYDGPIAVTPVCDRRECIDEALAWVTRMSRKPAHHVLDGSEGGGVNVGVAIIVAMVGLFLWGFAHGSRTPNGAWVAAVAIVGAVVLVLATGITGYRRRERRDAERTADVVPRLKQDTSGEHYWDGA